MRTPAASQLRPAAAGDDAVAERERLCRTITSALPALTDPRTGRSIVRAVYRREEIYHGPYLESLPDVIVVLEPEYAAMTSLADRSVVVPAAYRLRSGDHRDEGILMMHGPQIVPGQLATAPTLADLTPTILHLLNIPPSHPLDGRVLTEAFFATGCSSIHCTRHKRQPSTLCPSDLNIPLKNKRRSDIAWNRLGYL